MFLLEFVFSVYGMHIVLAYAMKVSRNILIMAVNAHSAVGNSKATSLTDTESSEESILAASVDPDPSRDSSSVGHCGDPGSTSSG